MYMLEQVKPELLSLTEKALERKLLPDPTICRLRLRFWDEYARAQDRSQLLRKDEVCRGVCSSDFFNRMVETDPLMIAWMILPPSNYVSTMEELLYRGLDRMREVLDLPFLDRKTGKPDTKLISEVVKIVHLLDQRVKGAIIQKVAIQQRIDQKTSHRHSFDAKNPDPLSQASANDLESIEAQLGSLNRQLLKWDQQAQESLNEQRALPVPTQVQVTRGNDERRNQGAEVFELSGFDSGEYKPGS